MARILVVDDEPSIVLAVKDELLFEGYEVDAAADGHAALSKARALRPDVLLLDLMLPGLNGFQICRQLRPEMPDMWIIIFTVRGQEADRITGFAAGADDYVTKPFSLRELVARVKVGLRRQRGNGAQPIAAFGEIELDRQAYRVTKRGAEVALTRKEFEILDLLARHPGAVITRDDFLDQLWGAEVYITHRVIDTHVAALRKKIEDDPNQPKYVLSVRGIGYKLGLLS
ncbi:MAG: response regulator transcription factor [Acidobacteria bacterium]|nr:response regulator transcription factor [Acidobacteriota bacterium]MBI3424475.1 response regulator transcription factor [Acidobacteriota bacterium]